MDMSKLGQQKETEQFNEEGKIHLGRLLLCGLCRDCGIPWSYRLKGWETFPEKVSDHEKILLRRQLEEMHTISETSCLLGGFKGFAI